LNITNLLNSAAPTLVALGLPLWRRRAARLRTTIADPRAAAGEAPRACGYPRAGSPRCEQPRRIVRTAWEHPLPQPGMATQLFETVVKWS
jgi:hypothetical protein